MGKLNWFQKLSTREVVGEVIDKQYATKGIATPITIYAVTDERQTVYRGGVIGHQASPNIGDRVEMYLEKGNVFARNSSQVQRKKPDGMIEVVQTETVWEAIKSYKVLENLV